MQHQRLLLLLLAAVLLPQWQEQALQVQHHLQLGQRLHLQVRRG
jgi:hypothetical protein